MRPGDPRAERGEDPHAQDGDRAQRTYQAVRDAQVALDGGLQRADGDDLGAQNERDAHQGDKRRQERPPIRAVGLHLSVCVGRFGR